MRTRPGPARQAAVDRGLERLAAELSEARSEQVPSADELVVPEPGRHSARTERFGGAAPAWWPSMLHGRTGLTAAHLGVVAALVLAAAVVTAWVVVGAGGDPVQEGQFAAAPRSSPTSPAVTGAPSAPPLVDLPTGSAGLAAPEGESTGAGTGSQIVVDVAGKVRRPGIAVLPSGSRVVDALEAAGGARRGVDLTGLNLARRLVDGEQILVGVAEARGLSPSVAPDATGGAAPLVDLNLAGPTELDGLPQIGPVTAAAIIAWRDAHGGFTAVEELLEVDGIGEATLAQVAPFVTV